MFIGRMRFRFERRHSCKMIGQSEKSGQTIVVHLVFSIETARELLDCKGATLLVGCRCELDREGWAVYGMLDGEG